MTTSKKTCQQQPSNISILDSMTNLNQELSHEKNEFSIMSWNILLKHFTTPSTYTCCEQRNVLWKYRLPRIISTLISYNSDIVCLQEVDGISFKGDIANSLPNKYNFITGEPIVLDKSRKETLTNVTLFNTNIFEYVYHKGSRCLVTVLLNKLHYNKCTLCNLRNKTLNIIDSLLNYFEKKQTKKNICVSRCVFIVNLHLNSGGGKEMEQLRYKQIKKSLNKIPYILQTIFNINNINNVYRKINIILTGDHNTGRNEKGLQMLYNGTEFKYEFKEAYQEGLKEIGNKNEDIQSQKTRIKYFPTYATNNKMFGIDHISYTSTNLILKSITHTIHNNWKKKHIDIHEKIEKNMIGCNAHGAHVPGLVVLPNKEISSDHMPISGIFTMENSCEVDEKGRCGLCSNDKKTKKKLKNKKRQKQKLTLIINNDIFPVIA